MDPLLYIVTTLFIQNYLLKFYNIYKLGVMTKLCVFCQVELKNYFVFYGYRILPEDILFDSYIIVKSISQ